MAAFWAGVLGGAIGWTVTALLFAAWLWTKWSRLKRDLPGMPGIKRIGPGVLEITFPCGHTEVVEATTAAELDDALNHHDRTHHDKDDYEENL